MSEAGTRKGSGAWRQKAYAPAATLLTFWATALNNISFANTDYFWIVIQALVCAGAAVLLSGLAWRGLGTVGRGLLVVLLLLNGQTLLDAGGRRLPAILERRLG